ncbi:MAG: hypothetical protein C0501_08445 [Isosphaera sp.]|nr:hypothetical protein [Isosphaera sp.]
MSRSRTRRGVWARRAVWGTLAVVAATGCNPLTTIAFLTHKDVKVPAEAPLAFAEGPKKNKEEVVVALFINQAAGHNLEFAQAEATLASELARRLPEMSKDGKQKIAVVPPKDVNRYKMKNPGWRTTDFSKRGRELGADFVLDINLDKMAMFQPGSQNNVYEGRADVTVDVYDVDAGPGEPKHACVHGFSYPRTGFRDAGSMPQSAFRKLFLENLAVEIARLHVDHKPTSGIAEGR